MRKVRELTTEEVNYIDGLLESNCTFDKDTGKSGRFCLVSGFEGGYSDIEVETIVKVFAYMKSIGVNPQ